MDLTLVFSLMGGLGMFLYGMKLMSDSLANVAGAKLRTILEKMTKNTFVGMLVGMAFTAVIQSSSATTVLVVSFVNAGLMNLYQATGIIMGANIGTTITGQLIAFNLSEIAPLFVLGGVIMVMSSKKPNIQKIGEVILGFGILFVGLSSMSAAMSTLKDSPVIVHALSTLTNPFLAILVGFAITAILQSSSATVGIIILLASQGLLQLHICFYIILGCNIGSCVSALIASLGGKKNAKRAAYIHFLFNVFGSLAIVVILQLFMPYIETGIMALTGSQHLTGQALHDAMARNVANAHTIFKVFQVIILYPFAKLIVKATYILVPGDDEEHGFTLQYISDKVAFSATTAIPQVIHEVERMAELARKNLNIAVNSLLNVDTSTQEEIAKNEEHIDFLNHAIFEYLNHINQTPLPDEDSRIIGPLFHVIADIERIGDHAKSIANITLTCERKKYRFTHERKVEIRELLTMVNSELELSLEMFTQKSLDHLSEILKLEDLIDRKEDRLQKAYLTDIKRKETAPREGMLYSDLAAALERVGDHATNIAFSILNDDSEEINRLIEEEHVDPSDYIL
ncbi:Na/Pi cotransporter family protein [Candidatus Stoquefichus sp. SB1]|jgi:phosphate:Na+ symporter|uniref:Na/Pi cotransporter family protein n=1 Tax=Candidatus Stoquefichus sp. SB1 TaxID=1658109 RepID=UPI00067EA7A9|nr:Na/Pi cotransporter family protein [Candidatus Stoquefichus sp. SB1]